MIDKIVERIIWLLKANKMTAAFLASKLNTHNSTVTDWKKGKTKPSAEALIRIAKIFDVSLTWLLIGEGDIRERPLLPGEQDGEFLRAYQTLNESDRAYIKVLVLAMAQYRANSEQRQEIAGLALNNNPGVFTQSCGKRKRKIRVFDLSASAGVGNYIEGDSPNSFYEFDEDTVPKTADFGIRISGDSMEPQIGNGTIAWVKEQPQVDNNTIGVFVLNGHAYCKKLVIDRQNERVWLTSLNEKYAPIAVYPDDSLKTVGLIV